MSEQPHYTSMASPSSVPTQRTTSGSTMVRRRLELDVLEHAPGQHGPIWMYPGNGQAEHVHIPEDELTAWTMKLKQPRHLLGEWPATAICGNDILSSVLYTPALVASKAGKLMPIPLLLVATVLYLFRFVYEEVVTAIPLNGGSYNALLNTTSKRMATVAATLSILSYLATGVVSASSGVYYLNQVVELPIVLTTVALLFVFAVIAWLGITESSRVALAIFVHHIVVLTVVAVAAFVYMVQHSDVMKANMRSKFPQIDFCGSMLDGNAVRAIFFGFGSSMLGITGFESSAQFVEEQKPGVFRKTLRNMWALVSIYNVSLGVLILGVLPLSDIYRHADYLLAETSLVAAGHWLKVWVCIDAFVVLSGAVLTSYVGITGLVRRLAGDRVLPAFLVRRNALRGTCHYILFLYFLLAASLVVILNAQVSVLGGVYTYAFLGLMVLFSCGCMLLKGKRADMPRDIHASWGTVLIGFVMVLIAMAANLLGDPKVLMYFSLYFIPVALVMFVMMERVRLLRLALAILQHVIPSRHARAMAVGEATAVDTMVDIQGHMQEPNVHQRTKQLFHTGARGGRTIANAIVEINNKPIVFFAKSANLTVLNKAILYVRCNEQTSTLRFVHVYEDPEEAAPLLAQFHEAVALFDYMYPKIRMDFVSVQGAFCPAVVEWLAQSMSIPTNMMFIAQPSHAEAHQVSSAGVRVITA